MEVVNDVKISGTNYVKNNVLHIGSLNSNEVMVESMSQIQDLPQDLFTPGAVAHTAGWKLAKEKAADGTWVTAIGG